MLYEKFELNHAVVSDLAIVGYCNNNFDVYANHELTDFVIVKEGDTPDNPIRKLKGIKKVEKFFEKIAVIYEN